LSEGVILNSYHDTDDKVLDIVFIHGLTGDEQKTWEVGKDNDFWPMWLVDDVPHIAVHSLGYPASKLEKWAKKELDIFEVANVALEYLTAKGIGAKPLAIVSHSLGGILAKVILRSAKESPNADWNSIAANARFVAFLATPHTGASLANALKVVFPRISSSHIATLKNDTGILHDINQSYRNFSDSRNKLQTVAYYEKYKTAKAVLVVSRESADPGVAGCTPVAISKNHSDICKPITRDDLIYISLLNRFKKLASSDDVISQSQNGESFEECGYDTKHATDRRDLLQKLIDGGREHEYSTANDNQTSFAAKYIKYGLYTRQRDDNDKLLSEVEQRFVTHIYQPLICKGAADSQIRDELQNKVIDPIFSNWNSKPGFTFKTIMGALYFLTEQCYIRWDAEA
jgi:hypothetical protein